MKARDVTALFGGTTKTAEVIGCSRRSVVHWHHIGIPLKHWPKLVAAAQARGIAGISFDTLGEIHDGAPKRIAAKARKAAKACEQQASAA